MATMKWPQLPATVKKRYGPGSNYGSITRSLPSGHPPDPSIWVHSKSERLVVSAKLTARRVPASARPGVTIRDEEELLPR